MPNLMSIERAEVETTKTYGARETPIESNSFVYCFN